MSSHASHVKFIISNGNLTVSWGYSEELNEWVSTTTMLKHSEYIDLSVTGTTLPNAYKITIKNERNYDQSKSVHFLFHKSLQIDIVLSILDLAFMAPHTSTITIYLCPQNQEAVRSKVKNLMDTYSDVVIE